MVRKQVKHIFFDLDHTLWDFDSNSKEALKQLHTRFELAALCKEDCSLESFLSTYAKNNDRCWAAYRKNEMSKEVLRYERFASTLKAFDIQDKALAETLGDEYVGISPYQTRLMPGAIEVLDHLQERYTLHIITNGFEEVQRIKLSESGLSPYFNQIITSEMVGVRKPDAKIFAHALQLAGTDREASLMIGDNLDADIFGALRMGIEAIFYNPHGHFHGKKIDLEINDLLQLKQWL